jgi:hypothetical protein
MIAIGIDCGIKYIGISMFENKELIYCNYISADRSCTSETEILISLMNNVKKDHVLMDKVNDNKANCKVLIEYPEQYSNSPAPRIHVQALAFTAGGLVNLFSEVGCTNVGIILPKEWKGQVPKDIFLKRIMSRLSVKEKEILTCRNFAKSKEHNVIDGIGIGLYSVSRI